MPFLYIPPHARLPHRTAHSSENVCSTPATPFVISRGVRTPVTNTATSANANKNELDADKHKASRRGPHSNNRHHYLQRHQKHRNPNKHTNAINQAARCGDIIRLESSVRAAKEDKYILNVLNYTTIADGYIRGKEPAKAFDVFAEMRSRQIKPTSASIRVAARAASAMTNHKLATESILSIIQCSIDSYTPDYTPEYIDHVRAWNHCLGALMHHGAVNQALKLLMKMMHESCDNPAIPFPDACSFNQCITYLGRSNRFLEAMSLFGTMLVGHYCRHHRNHVSPSPDVITFNAVLGAALIWDRQLPSCMNSPQGSPLSKPDTNNTKWDQPPNPTVSFVDAVVSCMDRRKVEPDLFTETLILRVLSRNHNFERQRDNQTNRLLAPEPESLSTKATSDLRRFTRSQIQRAISKFSMALDKPYFDAALAALGSTNDINMIIVVFRIMRSRAIRPDHFTIRALLKYTRASHDTALAEFLIRTTYSMGCQPDYRTYTMAIASCVDQPLVAHTLVKQAMENGVTLSPGMVNAAISTTGHDVSSAIRLWQQIRTKASAAEVDQILVSRVVYDALFRVCGRSGNPRDALRIWYACKNAKHVQPQSTDSRALFNAFMRGLDEGHKESEVKRNIFKNSYMKLLRTECGVPDNIEWPVERIRIKW